MTGREIVCTVPPALPGMLDTAIREDVERIFTMIQEEGGGMMLPALPDPALRTRLEARARELRSILRPISGAMAEKERAARAIATMMLGFLGGRKDVDAESLVAAYVLHLQDLPIFAIEQACKDVVSRRPRDMKPDYVPSSARLFDMATSCADAPRTEQWRIQKILSVQKMIPPPMSPERQEEMRQKLTALAARMRVNSAAEDAKQNEARAARKAEQAGRETQAMLREYERLGREPVYSGDILISPTLAKMAGAMGKRKANR